MRPNVESRLKLVSRDIQAAKATVEQAMAEMHANPDFEANEEMQIHFHRHQLPLLLGKWLFLQKCFALECLTLASTGDKRKVLLEGQLQHARDFFLAYRGFIQYYFSEDKKLDKDLFTTTCTVVHPVVEDGDELPDNLNQGCRLASYLLAYLEFAQLLLQESDEPVSEQPTALPAGTVTYKGKIIDVVEIGMLLWISKSFIVNGKPATEKFIFKRLELAFGIPVANMSQRISELKGRNEPLEKVKEWLRMANAHLGNLPADQPRRKLG
jgi:hypothetical protein